MYIPVSMRCGGKILALAGIALSLLCFGAPRAGAEIKDNRILSISVAEENSATRVDIRTERPVEQQYTAFDAEGPQRVVLEFSDMEVSQYAAPAQVAAPVKTIQVSESGAGGQKLGRVELLLTEVRPFDVVAEGNLFSVVFSPSDAPSSEEAGPASAVSAGRSEPALQAAEEIKTVLLEEGSAIVKTDGTVEKYRYFRLGNPPRLVVDLYGAKPAFHERSFRVSDGFRKMRLGVYEDKTRFVLDAAGSALPEHSVRQVGDSVVISWEDKASSVAAAPVKPAPEKGAAAARQGARVVEDIGFDLRGGSSVFEIDLSGPAEIIPLTAEGNLVRFGVKNARIGRALTRTIDTSAFPSAVERLTPYAVQNQGVQEVRFAAELKGKVPYRLEEKGDKILFVVENQAFAGPMPIPSQKLEVAAPAAATPPEAGEKQVAAPAPAPALPQRPSPSTAAPAVAGYTGEEISLVFDDANIRNILQLIGEVSNLNIIAGEEVKGTITLRLIDVPWDQALDLIMETKGLGMLRDGNVVRILPKDQIRAMRQAELTAVREERQLESLKTEVIPVSYSDLGNVAGPSRELLTDRGKITEDPRNKQLIVTDIPAAVEEIKALVSILDTPERQVMIEARIVEANANFSRDLGVKWGLSYQPDDSGTGDISRINVGLGGSFIIPPPAAGSVGSAGLGTGITFGRLGVDSSVIDLRISALENSGNGKVVSTPRVTTLNGGKALISQGTKIPYQSVSDQGTETKFENAELKLEVSPVINPDNSVILDIRASNSSVGATVPTGLGTAIAIDEKKAETKVLVRDGETTVIGGIFVEDERLSEAGVPLLMDIPILGHLFSSTTRTAERRELLVFITPRILN